jgi:PadR family transcriptional regulator PadR
VLAIVCRGDCYGYELVNRISESMRITEGTIYPLLKRLKDNGSITSYIVESQEGPPRKYYQITDIGRQEKERQEHEWRSFSESIGRLIEEGEKPNV